MLTVNEVSLLAGVTVRTLHYYDEAGVLKPAKRTASGARLYGEAELARLQCVLLLRELDFPVAQIAELMNSPSFDMTAALDEHIRLLELKRDRLNGLIAHARELRTKGENAMDFTSFDDSELTALREEARRRWQDTEAYSEYESRLKESGEEREKSAAERLMDVFREFGAIRSASPESAEARGLVLKLRDTITEGFYTCTDGILAGLGQMYVCDERFKSNIDSNCGEGTACFVSRAIAAYVASRE